MNSIRKLYIRIRLFFKTYKDIFNGITVVFMSMVLFGFFINAFVFERIIVPFANSNLISGNYKVAIQYYDIAQVYYKFFHFTGVNKDIYFEIPYFKAKCFIYTKDKEKAIQSMLGGMTEIQNQYGIFSKESAFFIRKYLIDFYLENHNVRLALSEYDNLLVIYKKIGYSDIETADLVRICGDIYYAQKQYDSAIIYYQRAYNAIQKSNAVDNNTFTKTTIRIADYEAQNEKYEVSDKIYSTSIEVLKAQTFKEEKYIAEMLLKQAENSEKMGKVSDELAHYEEAVEIIEKLPKTSYLHQNLDTYYTKMKTLYNEVGQYHKVEEVQLKIDRRRRLGIFA